MFASLIVRGLFDYARYMFKTPDSAARQWIKESIAKSDTKVDDVMFEMVDAALDNRKITRQKAKAVANAGKR